MNKKVIIFIIIILSIIISIAWFSSRPTAHQQILPETPVSLEKNIIDVESGGGKVSGSLVSYEEARKIIQNNKKTLIDLAKSLEEPKAINGPIVPLIENEVVPIVGEVDSPSKAKDMVGGGRQEKSVGGKSGAQESDVVGGWVEKIKLQNKLNSYINVGDGQRIDEYSLVKLNSDGSIKQEEKIKFGSSWTLELNDSKGEDIMTASINIDEGREYYTRSHEKAGTSDWQYGDYLAVLEYVFIAKEHDVLINGLKLENMWAVGIRSSDEVGSAERISMEGVGYVGGDKVSFSLSKDKLGMVCVFVNRPADKCVVVDK